MGRTDEGRFASLFVISILGGPTDPIETLENFQNVRLMRLKLTCLAEAELGMLLLL